MKYFICLFFITITLNSYATWTGLEDLFMPMDIDQILSKQAQSGDSISSSGINKKFDALLYLIQNNSSSSSSSNTILKFQSISSNSVRNFEIKKDSLITNLESIRLEKQDYRYFYTEDTIQRQDIRSTTDSISFNLGEICSTSAVTYQICSEIIDEFSCMNAGGQWEWTDNECLCEDLPKSCNNIDQPTCDDLGVNSNWNAFWDWGQNICIVTSEAVTLCPSYGGTVIDSPIPVETKEEFICRNEYASQFNYPINTDEITANDLKTQCMNLGFAFYTTHNANSNANTTPSGICSDSVEVKKHVSYNRQTSNGILSDSFGMIYNFQPTGDVDYQLAKLLSSCKHSNGIRLQDYFNAMKKEQLANSNENNLVSRDINIATDPIVCDLKYFE